MINLKRAYTQPEAADGYRVLVDRLWPRGLAKDAAQLDLWLKAIGPSKALRQQFHHGAITFTAFKSAYLQELQAPDGAAAVARLQGLIADKGTVTLVFASKDVQHNQAVVLQELLTGRLTL